MLVGILLYKSIPQKYSTVTLHTDFVPHVSQQAASLWCDSLNCLYCIYIYLFVQLLALFLFSLNRYKWSEEKAICILFAEHKIVWPHHCK